jgi:hypothetical protein
MFSCPVLFFPWVQVWFLSDVFAYDKTPNKLLNSLGFSFSPL